jgi:hypothetical protein
MDCCCLNCLNLDFRKIFKIMYGRAIQGRYAQRPYRKCHEIYL